MANTLYTWAFNPDRNATSLARYADAAPAPAHPGWRYMPRATGLSERDHINQPHRAHHFDPPIGKAFHLKGCVRCTRAPAAYNISTHPQPNTSHTLPPAPLPDPGRPSSLPTPRPPSRYQCAPSPDARLPGSSARSHCASGSNQSPRTADRHSLCSQASFVVEVSTPRLLRDITTREGLGPALHRIRPATHCALLGLATGSAISSETSTLAAGGGACPAGVGDGVDVRLATVCGSRRTVEDISGATAATA